MEGFNSEGVIGLPLKMVVSIVIGGVALSAVLYFLSSQCIYPRELDVQWDPLVIENEKTSEIQVEVKSDGKAIERANIVIIGLGNASSGKTDENGQATLYFTPHMKGRSEGYVSIRVTAGRCYKTFVEKNAIKVVEK